MLQNYFRSGWAFLIPYLAAYLLYAWLKWPVNAGGAGEGIVKGISESDGTLQSTAHSLLSTGVPCLLHLYWLLHGVHVLLGTLALRSWWKGSILNLQLPTSTGAHSAHLLSTVYRLLPWLCLGLLFYIPGVYLEWPSDPWEHLRRINEWRVLDTVTAHSSWMKSSYFIPYSLLSWCVGLRQIFWLDFYYTGICLLLCWQYYRLARACDLSERASMVFVLLQALLFGNNIFSFYRYYGLSSSILAQIGAVALTRVAIEALRPREGQGARSRGQGTDHDATPSLSKEPALSQSRGYSLPATRYSLLQLVGATVILLPLIAFNHIQGLGIAGLGILAVIVWRLSKCRRSMIWWLTGVALLLSLATVLWFPRHPAIGEVYRPLNWLTPWYGFNLFQRSSPAFDKIMQIIGSFGVLNLGIGFWLIARRSHVVGWLTVMPIIALSLPCFALPITHVVASQTSTENIITFQRMLLAIPPCLALAFFLEELMAKFPVQKNRFLVSVLLYAAIIAITTIPNSSPTYNRFWNTISVVSNDFQLQDIYEQYEAIKVQSSNNIELKVITTRAGTALLSSYAFDLIGPGQFRMIGIPATDSITKALDFIVSNSRNETFQPAYPAQAVQNHGIVYHLNLITDPKASAPDAWTTLGGSPPEFISEIADPPTTSTALQSPAGALSNPFTSAMIPVERLKSYRLEMTVKQAGNTGAIVYLAVAWYDAGHRFLESHPAQPIGAGNPRGWVNGTYSYFGLVSHPAPMSWTTFGVSFGLNETTAIPSNARFARVGALLNYNTVPSAMIQLTDVRLCEKPTPPIGLAIPNATSAYSHASQAAQLSMHWPPQQVMLDSSGTKEILAAALIVTPAASR